MSIKQVIEALESIYHALPDFLPSGVNERFSKTGKWASQFNHNGITMTVTCRADDLETVCNAMDTVNAALAALRSMPQGEPVATIRYERGTPGKENDMPKVVSCNWLPDGVYSVYATPHTAPAPAEPGAQFTDRHEIAWTDKDGVHHSMGIEGARSLLGKFWDEWPGGWSEVEAEKLARATPHTEAVRMSEAEIEGLWSDCWDDYQPGGDAQLRQQFARAVEKATAARLGVKMGDV